MARGEARMSLNLRVTVEIKDDVEDFAMRSGLSLNAAGNLLLAQALRTERLLARADVRDNDQDK